MAWKNKKKAKSYLRKWEKRNKSKRRIINARMRAKVKAIARYNKHWAPCKDCKIKYPFWIMQYDHVTDDKIGDVARIAAEYSITKLLTEIHKCEIVCANCHANRTYKRIIAEIA